MFTSAPFASEMSANAIQLETSVAKAMKVLRKLRYCLHIELEMVRACVEMVVIKLFCLAKSQKLLSKLRLYSIHDVISY